MKWPERKWVLRAGLAGVVALVGIQFVPVELVDNNPAQRHELEAPADVKAALNVACFDCHSNETKWPWYSHIAPMSWGIADHVGEGRDALNFSEWGSRSEEDKAIDRETVWEEIESGEMPLEGYVLLHAAAKLNAAQLSAIKAWSTPKTEPPVVAEPAAIADVKNADSSPKPDAGPDEPASAEDKGEVAKGEATKPTVPKSLDAKPAVPKGSKASAPLPKPAPKAKPAPKVYDGPNPCRAKSFKFAGVRSACQTGGLTKAKGMMKYLVKKAKANGTKFKCSSCHANQKDYRQKPNANSDYRKLLAAAK